MNKLPEMLSESILRTRGRLGIRDRVETCCRDLGCEPIGFGEADNEGNEVLFDLSLGQVITYFVERFDCLRYLSGEEIYGWGDNKRGGDRSCI